MFRGTKSPSPASSNYDFTLRHERVKLFAKVLKQFDANITRTMQAMRDVAGSLSLVGQTYHEVAQCVNNTNPQSAMNRAYPMLSHMNSNCVVENYGVNLQGAASVFASEMKGLREGEQYVAFNGGVHQTVLARLHEVITRAKKTSEVGDDVATALRKAVAAKKVVQKKEAKYVRLGKPLTESKLHGKQVEEMQRREQNYETMLRAFDTEYEALMQRQLYVAGHTMDDFLDINTVYVAQILKVLSCLAPNGADAVANMVDATQDLADRLHIAPQDQVTSRLKSRDANVTYSKSCNTTNASSKNISPMKGTPGKVGQGSSHNFTSYYLNRKHRGVSAEQAPPTTRALDDNDGDTDVHVEDRTPTITRTGTAAAAAAAPSNFWSTPGTPQGRSVVQSEPDPSPPPPCPSNPMARFSTHPKNTSVTTVASGPAATSGAGTAAMPVVPRSGGAVIEKPSRKAAVAPAAAAAVVAPPPLTLERSVTLSPGRAPFGDGTTPAFHQQSQHRLSPPPAAVVPATSLAAARSPSNIVVSPSTHRRTTVLQAQAAELGLDRARSTEPFDDDCPKGVVSYTARSTLQPVNLLPAMEAAAVVDQPSAVQRTRKEPPPQRHANPFALNSSSSFSNNTSNDGVARHRNSGPLRSPQDQPPPRKSTRRSGTLPAAPAACAAASAAGYAPPRERPARSAAAPLLASAPPPDDATLSSSVNSPFLGASNSASFQESLSFSYGQSNGHHNTLHASGVFSPSYQFNNSNSATTPFVPATADAVKAHSNHDTWETETGGVTGRSHALSTSYALDSPSNAAPHLRGMEVRSWESNEERACSPA